MYLWQTRGHMHTQNEDGDEAQGQPNCSLPGADGLECLAQGHNGGRLYGAGSFRYTLHNKGCSMILTLSEESIYQESFFIL